VIDPLVDEVRKAGQAYIDSFKGDRKAMLEDLRRRQQEEGRQVVKLPSKPPRRRPAKRAKTGVATVKKGPRQEGDNSF
jgi:LDH2 family malate/lactate/ureidoglycolate dehydrogenase